MWRGWRCGGHTCTRVHESMYGGIWTHVSCRCWPPVPFFLTLHGSPGTQFPCCLHPLSQLSWLQRMAVAELTLASLEQPPAG